MNYKKRNKKKYISIIIVLALVLGATTAFLAQMSDESQGYRTISVVEVSGRVSVVKDGIEYSAYPGMLLQEGQEVITGGDSFVRLVLDEDKYIKLESGSRAVFETLGLLGSGKTQINLERGSLTSELVNPLGAEDSYVVNTPNAVLAVRGTFFRVDLFIKNDGDVTADVMTYGGQVASQRIQPSGEVVEEEVLIDAGYKATINMTPVETNYVVETEAGEAIVVEPTLSTGVENESTEVMLPTQPITTADIPDEDLVDVYFAAENGHELFITAEEVKIDLEEREILIEEYRPVYEKAEEVKKQQEEASKPIGGTSNTTSASIKADDSQPMAKVEEKPAKEESDSTNSTVGNSAGTGLVDGVHVHKEVTKTTEATCTTAGSKVVTCRNCKETLSETEIPALGHTYVESVIKESTCTTVGEKEFSCDCGYTYTEEIAALGHNFENDYTIDKAATCTTEGSKSKHCANCEEVKDVTTIAATGHTMTQTTYVAPNCTKNGSSTYSCDCGYTYTEEIAALGHNFEGEFTIDKTATCTTEGSKSKHCVQCNEVKDVTTIAALGHTMTQTAYVAPECTKNGSKTYTCVCGYTNIDEIAATGHNYVSKVDATTGDGYEECNNCGDIIWDFNPVCLDSTNFPDENFRAFLATTAYDINQDGYLSKTEIENITTLALAGEGAAGEITVDGGISDLTGIEHLTSLNTLNVNYNANLTELDLSQNTQIQYVMASSTGIKTFNASNCTELVAISMDSNKQLSDMMISDCIHLKSLLLSSSTGLTELDISKNTELTNINLSYITGLESLILNESGYDDIMVLTVIDTGVNDFDFELFSNVETLAIDASRSECNLSPCNNISTLQIYPGDGLEYLSCSSPSLTSISFILENSIKELRLKDTQITELDVSTCTQLETLEVSNTPITSLDLEGLSTVNNVMNTDCEQLSYLNLGRTSVTGINLTGCTSLKSLSVSGVTTLNSFLSYTIPDDVEITYLNINNTDYEIDELGNGMAWMDSLKEVHWQNANLTDEEWNIISSKLTDNLEVLDLVANTGITSIDVNAYPNLQRLNLANCTQVETVDVSSATELEELFIPNTNIRILNLNGLSNLKSLYLTGCTNLGYLDISGTALTNDQVDWSACTNLNDLYMKNCSNMTWETLTIGEGGVAPSLATLEISGLDIGTLEINTSTLETLVVSSCGADIVFTDASQLSTLQLNTCYGVSSIDLSNTDLNDVDLINLEGLENLVMDNCINLSRLTIQDCNNLISTSFEGAFEIGEVNVLNCGMTTLDFSGAIGLSTLYIDNCTSLARLELTNCTNVSQIQLVGHTEGNELTVNITGTSITSDIFSGIEENDLLLVTQ